MNIFPLHAEEARKRHWVVRTLRYFGYLDAIAGIIVGIVYGNAMGPLLLAQLGVPFDTAHIIALPLGGLLGFCAGLLVGLPFWGLALIADDLHALRIYASGMVVLEDRQKNLAKN